MNTSNIFTAPNEKKLNLITAFLILLGILISFCLVFLFIQLFKARSDMITPKIYKAEQIGATDSSVLLAWSGSDAAKEFVVRYRSTDSSETTEFRTDKQFAAIHGLKPYKRYKAVIAPVDDQNEYEPVIVICNTSPYSNVTEVNVDNVTYNSAHVTWKYEGIDAGFTVIAYAVDKNGIRHETSEKINISKGADNECTLDNLLSELNYTVCVMPDTRYASVKKQAFTTEKNSITYNKYKIVRFAICNAEFEDSLRVNSLSSITANNAYKSSMILTGNAEPTEKIDMEIYITDPEGTVVSHSKAKDVVVNPDETKTFFYRSFVVDFTAPSDPGDYRLLAAIDGETVRKTSFKVT